jgi:hypothetical protein
LIFGAIEGRDLRTSGLLAIQSVHQFDTTGATIEESRAANFFNRLNGAKKRIGLDRE